MIGQGAIDDPVDSLRRHLHRPQAGGHADARIESGHGIGQIGVVGQAEGSRQAKILVADMPASLGAMKVPPEAVDRVVDGALADHSLPTNPRPLGRDELRELFFAAYG
jgi:hypothetical protein